MMKTLDFTGLNEAKVANVVSGLNQLLADLQVYYTNLRNFHWNVKGHSFFSLHAKYEELYDDASTKVDDVAERLLQLGAVPESRFSEYLKVSHIAEAEVADGGRETVETVLGYFKTLIAQERRVLAAAAEAGDEVTAALMGDYVREQEKTVWMLVAFASGPGQECK